MDGLATAFTGGAFADALALLQAVQVELFVFVIAVATHLCLCGRFTSTRKTKAKTIPDSRGPADQKMGLAAQRGDPRAVRAAQLRTGGAASPLTGAVELALRQGTDSAGIQKMLSEHLTSVPHCHDGHVQALAAVLEGLGKGASNEALAAVHRTLQLHNLSTGSELGELLLRGYLAQRNLKEFHAVLGDLEANSSMTPGSRVLVLKAAIKAGDFDAALQAFRQLTEIVRHDETTGSGFSCAPQYVLLKLVDLAAKKERLEELLPVLASTDLSAEVLNAVLNEARHRGDTGLFCHAEDLGRKSGVVFNGATYSALIHAAASSRAARRIFDEAVAAGQVIPELVVAMLEFEGSHADAKLASEVYRQFLPNPPAEVVLALLHHHAKRGDHRMVCDLYEKHLKGVSLGLEKQQLVVTSSLACKRQAPMEQLLKMLDVPRRVALIKACGVDQGIRAAEAVFRLCPEPNCVLYNAVLDTCVQARDLKSAEQWMKEAVNHDMADVVTYNTLIKAHLASGRVRRARGIIQDMQKEGLQPNLVTFNELLDAAHAAGSRDEMWQILSEMKSCGLKPNYITCSILLKNIQPKSPSADVERAMEVVNALESLDEILLSSIVEACVRVGRADLLHTTLQRQRKTSSGSGRVEIKGAHAYGSLIRGHGLIRDLPGVWATWKEMRMRHIVPTSITLGCMVEALVTNDDPDRGYELIKEMEADRQCCSTVNAVIYCSVLKGFAHQRRMDHVWPVYQEMLEKDLDFTIVTYNTLVDACARCGHMQHLPQLLRDMKRKSIEPNVITYSAILKGHCQAGDFEKGLEVLETMKRETNLKPDEIMYNSLLDGCVRSNLYEQGIELLSEMEQAGVRPSNFTLSIVVKLASRAKKLDMAFELADRIAQRYHFRLNVHVFTNLVQGCVCHRDLARGLQVLERMLKEHVRPDGRTYTLLIQGFISAGQPEIAVGLLRAACGLPDPLPQLTCFGDSARPASFPPSLASDTLGMLMDRGHAEHLAVPLLQDLKRLRPGISINPQVKLRLTTEVTCRDSRDSRRAQRAGAARFC